MQKFRVLTSVSGAALAVTAFLSALLAPATAAAEDSPVAGRFGVGIVSTLGPNTGLNVVYDGGPWHADATLALSDVDSDSRIGIGAHGWFHLHHGASSDFSLGGGLTLDRYNPSGAPPVQSRVGIDLGMQIRAFVTSNVAVGARGGLLVLTGDQDGFVLGGEPVGEFSLTYFF
jgi:hypothetical protein